MKFSKKHFIVGLIGNLLVFVVGLVGIVMMLIEFKNTLDSLFLYFTTLSNIFVTLVSFINAVVYMVSLAKGKNYVKEGLQVLKLIAVVTVAITFTMVIIFLMPHNTSVNFYGGSQLFLHAITPLVAVASFIFLEYQTKIRFRFFFMPIIAVLVYGIFYTVYAFTAKAGSVIDWYGFLFSADGRAAPADMSKFTTLNCLIFAGESIGGAAVFGFVFWLLNKIMNLIFIGYTLEEDNEPEQEYYDEIELPVEEKKEEAAPVEEAKAESKKPAASKKKTTTSKPKTAKYKDGARVYHISRSKLVSRSWQVKLATGEKAIKIFPTQAEAIAFAKQLVKSQGGSIRIHSMKGQLRK